MKFLKNSKIILLVAATAAFCFLIVKPGVLVFAQETENATPSSSEDEKVKEIRDAIKEKVNEIKDKIEKRAYVGIINQITDSTLTLENFRGKRRVRLTEETIIIATNKKEIKQNELALEDKVIAMGTMGSNEILEAIRVVVVPKPSVLQAENNITLGTIVSVNSKTSRMMFSPTSNPDNEIEVKTDIGTKIKEYLSSGNLKFANLKQNQKIIIVYPKAKEDELPLAKSIFVLP